jgi:hypothetical protein
MPTRTLTRRLWPAWLWTVVGLFACATQFANALFFASLLEPSLPRQVVTTVVPLADQPRAVEQVAPEQPDALQRDPRIWTLPIGRINGHIIED